MRGILPDVHPTGVTNNFASQGGAVERAETIFAGKERRSGQGFSSIRKLFSCTENRKKRKQWGEKKSLGPTS